MINKNNLVFGNNIARKRIRGGGKGKEYILYPTGVVCKEVFHNLSKYGANIIAFGDRDPAKIGKSLYQLPILSFDEIVESYRHAYIVISSRKYYYEIYEQFLNAGLDQEHVILVDYSAFDPDFDQENYVLSHFEQYEKVYDWLGDEESRNIFISLLNYRMTFDYQFIEQIKKTVYPQYFDKELIQFHSNEIFVDCGGFTGDTYSIFQQICPDYKKYYLFEPNSNNIAVARENIKNEPRVIFINKGVYDKEDTLSFYNSSAESSIRFDGENRIEVVAIDSLLSKEPVTFIKMDIEGSERQALRGAVKTIQSHRPRLAISIYHKPQDLLQIPIFIKEINPSYRLYLRHYSNSFTETICYAL